jgi:hypothetical protein
MLVINILSYEHHNLYPRTNFYTFNHHLNINEYLSFDNKNSVLNCLSLPRIGSYDIIKKWVKDRKGRVAYVYQILRGCDISKMCTCQKFNKVGKQEVDQQQT